LGHLSPPLDFVTVLCYDDGEVVGMLSEWFDAERTALAQHRLRQAQAEKWRLSQDRRRQARIRRELERSLARAMKALPREELQALVARALRATG